MAFVRGQARRRLRLREILAELDAPAEPGRTVCGYQVKVGSEREPYWLLVDSTGYAVTDRRPVEPPFSTELEAQRAQQWFVATYPDFAWLRETVSLPIFARVAVPA